MGIHVNPETGGTGQCRAKLESCPFSPDDNHFETVEEARASYEEFAEALADKDKSVFFNFTHQQHYEYTNGSCGALALALSKKTGYPVVILVGADKSGTRSETFFEHAGVETPDGRILDVEGLWTRQEWLANWEFSEDDLLPASEQFEKDTKEYVATEYSPVKLANRILKVLN